MASAPKRNALAMREPDGYVGWSSAQKADWLWTRVIEGTRYKHTELPSLTLPFRTAPLTEAGIVMRTGELEKALNRTSDLMEPGRPKVIHAHGTVAQVRLTPADSSPFTGLLDAERSSDPIGLVRMSLVARVFGDAAYTPAMALKFLIDAQPSADVLAMNHTVGQGRDYNVFANDFTNDLTHTHEELRTAQRIMSFFFKRVSHNPRRMVSNHLANRRSDGTDVENPYSPDRLVFRPTAVAKAIFTDRAGVDFRLVLAELEPGTTIYEVDGIVGSTTHPVGSLSITSDFVPSAGGDRLFFRHVHDPKDHKNPPATQRRSIRS